MAVRRDSCAVDHVSSFYAPGNKKPDADEEARLPQTVLFAKREEQKPETVQLKKIAWSRFSLGNVPTRFVSIRASSMEQSCHF